MRKKRLIIFLFFVLMFLFCFLVTVSAEESGTWGNLSWHFSDSGVLTISGSGDMDDFDSVVTAWKLLHFAFVKEIIIQDGITSIGIVPLVPFIMPPLGTIRREGRFPMAFRRCILWRIKDFVLPVLK